MALEMTFIIIKLETSRISFLNQILAKYCIKYNFKFLDLTTPMQKDFRMKQLHFESKYDAHWNEYGHKFVASEIIKNNLLYR